MKKRSYLIIILVSLALIPILIPFFVVGFHSNEFVLKPIHYISFLLLFLNLILLIATSILYIQKKEKKKKKEFLTPFWKYFCIIMISLEWIGSSTFLILLYGPFSNFRSWLIPTAMTTMNHQYFATWFYSKAEINEVLNENQIIERDEDTDLNLIKIGDTNDSQIYENEYEKEILTKEPNNDIYKIIKISGYGYTGYLAAIYDPSKVIVGVTKYLNNKGQYVTDMAHDKEAILAINGGGFIDPNYSSNGGTPHGIVIQDGKILSNQSYDSTGGLIGFTEDNKLLLGKMSANEALSKGIRDAVTFGPFLIVNGKKSFIKGNGGWGTAPRTAIAQRKDGIVLFLVIDGRKLKYPGADMVDLTEILANYGAYNAANLDGGTSSVMVLPQKESEKYLSDDELKRNCRNEYCYINDPIDGGGSHETRWVATSFLVKK